MKKHESTSPSYHRNSLQSTAINRFVITLMIFCFIEHAAGSCLSYGHSCWGAHGKRSYNGPRVSQHRQIEMRDDGFPVAEVKMDDNSATMDSQKRRFLSRLITGQLAILAAAPTAGKNYDNSRHDKQRILALPEKWDNDYDMTSNEIFRNEKVESNEMTEDSKDPDNPYGSSRKMKSNDEKMELLLVPSRNEFTNRHPNHGRNLRLYKLLADSSETTV